MNTIKGIGQGCLMVIFFFLVLIAFAIAKGLADFLLALPFYALFKFLEFVGQLPYWVYGILAVAAVLMVRNYNIKKNNSNDDFYQDEENI